MGPHSTVDFKEQKFSKTGIKEDVIVLHQTRPKSCSVDEHNFSTVVFR